MRHVISLILISFGIVGFSQSVKPYFSAIIVEDIEVSKAWYMEKLSFSILTEMSSEAHGFKQANLSLGGGLLIELLEIEAVSIKNPDKVSETPQFSLGIFKIGFLVNDFDQLIANLRSSGVEFRGDVVKDDNLNKRMVIVKDPDGNRIQLFED